MKFLLVTRFSEVEPLGCLYLSAALKRAGHSCQIYLYKPSEFSVFEVPDKVREIRPDVVGFSTYTGEHNHVYSFCESLKGSGIKTAIGGPHTLYFADECREHADYVFQGEALVSLPLLDDKTLYPLVDVKDIPHPDRQGLYEVSEFHKNNRIKNIMCSFGCPYDCSYCYNPLYKEHYQSGKVRLRPVDDVIDEAKEIDSSLIFFQDDCFGFSMPWLKEFADKWNGRAYHCQLRFEMATPERLQLLKMSGCTGVTCAIESANRDTRFNLLNRKVEDGQILEGARLIKMYGLQLRTEQMIGLPETTKEDDLKLLKWNVDINPTIAWASIYQPYLGTPLGEYCVKQGYYSGDNSDIAGDFFNGSALNFDITRKAEIKALRDIFSVCAHIPDGDKLADKIMSGASMQEAIKPHLYNILYG
jgi:radical SAM superfamily enzyme YgiQ (UPF0313 family)